MKDTVDEAIRELEKGNFVMVYDADGREMETDLVTPSEKITPKNVFQLRHDAGGLLCVTVPPNTWKKLGLPYLQDIIQSSKDHHPILEYMEADDIPYDERSTFSLTINHRDTFTGITDRDRALTIQRFSLLGKDIEDMSVPEAQEAFGDEFRAPGHVHLLNATDGLLNNRQGHTELTTALMEFTELYPSMTICEMLSSEGGSLEEDEAREYGEENGIPLIEGSQIIERWEEEYG